ncbi:MAG: TIGR00725 family protein [Aquificaceae bacterium]|nr:TIGR00725 family protein [Aquificaceae bacterium]MCX8164065.1 TIGR00725 family protein [Aquificaceae bacterium]
MRQVAVIGSSLAEPEDEEYRVAYMLGKEIARRGWVVVCGGRGGVMEAVCKGAKEEGGLTVGILPSYEGEEANSYVDIKIRTGMGWNRNPLVVASGDVVVAIGGNWGTLSEIAYSLILGKPIIGYKTHDVDGVVQAPSIEEILGFLDGINR